MKLASWLKAREPRERLVLALGIACIMLTGLFLALEPMYEEYKYRSREIPRLEADLGWMQSQLAAIKPGEDRASRTSINEVSVLSVEKLIGESKLPKYLSSMKPGNSGGVSLGFDKVPYTQFVEFIYAVRAEHGPVIRKVYIEPLHEEAGMITVKMELADKKQG